MSERIEGGFAAVGALPGIAYAAEGERRDRAVEEGVIYGSAAGGYFVEDCVLLVWPGI